MRSIWYRPSSTSREDLILARPRARARWFCSFIVIASSNEYSRKILNSPTYAEPCLTSSAKPILLKENW